MSSARPLEALRRRSLGSRVREFVIEIFFLLNGLLAMAILAGIFVLLIAEGLPAILELGAAFIGTYWNPTAYGEPSYGTLAMVVSTMMVSFGALLIAVPGMLTGAILGLARAAGETAPILFTGVAFFLPFLPESVHDQFMALPYHLYVLATQHHAIAQVRPLAYGTALVLIVLVLLLNVSAILIRYHFRRRLRG